tara:strand:- start:1430 stop:1897 length:468 start_codon:yes stop_codon:yes gene_type:complete
MKNVFKPLIKKFNKNLNGDSKNILSVLLAIFIVFDVKVPLFLAKLVDTLVGKITVIAIAIILLSSKHVLGFLGIIAAYVLINRSENRTGSKSLGRFVPKESNRIEKMNDMNTDTVSLEEEIVNKEEKINQDKDLEYTLVKASYVPVEEENDTASV